MANPVIFPGSTKSTWSFTKDGASFGTVYLFTTGDGPSRVELVNHERLTLEEKSHDPIFTLKT